MSAEGYVKLDIEDEIGTVAFFHPASNSLPGDLLEKLAQTIREAGENDAVKVIVLKSAGDRAFCAGASFDELMAIDNYEDGKVFFSGFANVINAMRSCPKFILGRIQGKAVGGGVGLASAVDYCYATTFSSVKLSELAVGIGPFVVGPAVERKIGVSGLSELAINATAWRDASWAQQKGLYNEVFDNIEALDEALMQLAHKLKASNPEAMRLMKYAFWQGTEHWDMLLLERAAMSGKLVLSEFTKNAIAQFKKKA